MGKKKKVAGGVGKVVECARTEEQMRVIRPLRDRPEDPDQLHQWVVRTLGIHVTTTAMVTGHAAPFDYLRYVFFEGEFEEMPRRADGVLTITASRPPADVILWANRGGGKTLLGAIATLLDMLYKPGIAVRVLAGSVEQSGKMMGHLRRFFDPEFSRALAKQVKGKVTERRIVLKNGSEVEVLAQSQTSVRGTHVQKLRCDEVDLFDPAVWEAAQFTVQSMECGGRLVRGSVECLSTMHEPHGLMHKLVMEAEEGKRTLLKWGLLDVLERCGPGRECDGTGNSKSQIANSKGASGTGADSTLRIADEGGGASGSAGIGGAHSESKSPAETGGPPTDSAESAEPRVVLAVLPYGAKEGPCPLKKECGGRAKEKGRVGHYRIEDAIAAKGRVGEEEWETEMLCTAVLKTDAVFPKFRKERHVITGTGARRVLQWVAGMDFGIRAPTVVLWAALDEEGAIWVMDERSVSEEVLDEHVKAMRAGLAREGVAGWPPVSWVAADPAGNAINPQTGVSDTCVLRRSGFMVKAPIAPVRRGIEMINARLAPAVGGWPRLFVHERCRVLIKSMARYRWKEGEKREPLKDGNDHAVDALRYLVVSVDSEGVKRGDYLKAA